MAYRVLVVEDNHEVRRMVTASLKTLSAEIDVLDVPSAEEALVISATLQLDLVVLDFRLPGMTGLDMVTRLRKRRPEAKIILVTGVEDPAIRQQIAQAQAEAFFFKPIEVDKFLEAAKSCLWGGPAELVLAPPVSQPAATAPETHPIQSPPPASATASSAAQKTAQPAAHIAVQPTAHTAFQPAAQPAAPQGYLPTLDERLTSLKQQLRAVSVLLVSEAGQVLEVAGNPSQLTAGSALFTSLMDAFHAAVQIAQATGRVSSLQFFASQRQTLYVVPVGFNHALFAVTSGNFESDKLSTIDRYFQLAVRDLLDILARLAAEELTRQANLDKLRADLPTQIPVDRATRQRVDEMLSKAGKAANQQEADSFWDDLGEGDAQDKGHAKDTLTYDQAHDLGITPGDKKPG